MARFINNERIKADKVDKTKILIPEKWFGICNTVRTTHTLTPVFVEQNFTTGFIDQVKRMCEGKNTHYINVPPSSNKHHHFMPKPVTSAPVIKFK